MKLSTQYLAYDFTHKSPITLLIFSGAGGTNNLEKQIDGYHKRLRALGKFNVVVVREYTPTSYTLCFNGLPQMCDDLPGVGRMLAELLYVKNRTQRAFVFADCAGCHTALATSHFVKYHRIVFTTPVLWLTRDESWETGKAMMIGQNYMTEIRNKFQDQQSLFDGMPAVEKFLNEGGMLDLHWAKNVIGSDKMYRDAIRPLERRLNLNVYEHEIPYKHDPHLLESHLWKTGQMRAIIAKAVMEEIKLLPLSSPFRQPSL